MINLIQYLFIPLIVFSLVIVLINWSGKSDNAVSSQHEDRELIFRVSKRITYSMIAISLLSVVMGFIGFALANHVGVFLLSLGLFFAALGVFEVLRMFRARIIVADTHLIYYTGVGSADKRIALSSIKSVVRANGSVIIDTGTIPRLVIPAYFSRIHFLVDLLRANAADNARTSQQRVVVDWGVRKCE